MGEGANREVVDARFRVLAGDVEGEAAGGFEASGGAFGPANSFGAFLGSEVVQEDQLGVLGQRFVELVE